jgi:hypothetical protein
MAFEITCQEKMLKKFCETIEKTKTLKTCLLQVTVNNNFVLFYCFGI